VTTAPPNANAAQQKAAPRESRTNETCSKGSKSTRQRKVQVWIKVPVRRGEELNAWIWDRCIHLAHAGATADSTTKLLHDLVGHEAKCGEIERAVRRAFAAVRGKTPGVTAAGGRTAPKWPEPDHAALVRAYEDHPATVEDLAALSPATAPDHPLDVLRELHRADDADLLCLGIKPTGPFYTQTFATWEHWRRDLPRWEMCVPNLMRSESGTTDEGKRSARCRDNSCGKGGQRFLVVEVDLSSDAPVVAELGARPADVCAAVIIHKLGLQHVRMVVESGNRSLHAWVEAGGRTQDKIEHFYRVWRRFAVDWRGSLPEQQFRLPQGFREDKDKVQRVIFWNPEGTR
jgi:hypothetical protein